MSASAAGYSKISDGVYQMLDGTSVNGVIARGIDVSHWQGSIDWQRAARDDISFVMLGARYSGQVDPLFRENAAGAARAGVKLGAYIYSYATDVAMAEAEADFVLDLIKDYPISYPVAFDMEDSSQSSLPADQLTAMINAFCKKIADAGYHPILYANDYWLANKIDMSQIKYDVWVARYEVKHSFSNPVMWQATSSGSVDGVTGGVDIDFQYKDFSDKIKPNLWRTINGKTYYYQNHTMQKNTWIDDGTGWFFMNSDGQAVTGWLTQNGTVYYLDPSTRRMTVGWLSTDEGWRYFSGSGAMQSGWIQDNGSWYYLGSNALMQTGWIQDGQAWYYLGSSGSMATGWKQIGNSWYCFNGSGAMRTGWVNDNGTWYYLSGSGAMQTGWVEQNGARYYLNPANGAMFANTQITVDGINYQVDESGACTEILPETEPEIPGGMPAEAPGGSTAEVPAPDVLPGDPPDIVYVPPVDFQ